MLYGVGGILLTGFVVLGAWSPSYESLPMQSFGYTWIALFFALLLLLALSQPTGPVAWIGRRKWLRELGRVSYCLYLVHCGLQLVGQAILTAVLRNGHSWEGIATRALTAGISYGVARASWVYFEHPLVKRGHAFKY
jgi:peptidoglycan/LPS O-acetylase OafA/YrhL